MKNAAPWKWLTLICLLFLTVFVLAPVLNMIGASLENADGTLSLGGFRQFFCDPIYVEGFFNSLILALVVTGCTLLLGIPLAWATLRYQLPFKALLGLLPITVMIIPELITTQAWIFVFGYNGFVTGFLEKFGFEMPRFYGWFGLIFVMTLTYYVHIYMGALAALKSFDMQLEEAAQSLGRPPIIARVKTMGPLVAPGILSTAFVVFTLVLGNFSVAIILGQGVPLLSVLTYNSFLSEIGVNPLMQSTLATVSLLIVGTVLLAQKQLLGKKNYEMVQGRALKPVSIKGRTGAAVLLPVLILLSVTLLPLVLVAAGSVTRSLGPVMYWGQFTLSHFIRVYRHGGPILVNSLTYAFCATLIGVIFGATVSFLTIKKKNRFTRYLDLTAMLPLAISGTVLGISLSQAFHAGPLISGGTPAIMILALIVRRLPFPVRHASANLYNISDSLEQASVSLGVPPVKSVFNVVVPLMVPGITAAAILMWALTMAEVNATLIVYQAGQQTLPIQIFRMIDSDLMGQASAYGVTMIGIILMPIFIAVKVCKLRLFN